MAALSRGRQGRTQEAVEGTDFKGLQVAKSDIFHAAFFHVRQAVSCRDLEENLTERGVVVDHATLKRYVSGTYRKYTA